jgi:hypothetical protein
VTIDIEECRCPIYTPLSSRGEDWYEVHAFGRPVATVYGDVAMYGVQLEYEVNPCPLRPTEVCEDLDSLAALLDDAASMVMMECPDCDGMGGSSGICGMCSGSGEGMSERSNCSVCKGCGESWYECSLCNGDRQCPAVDAMEAGHEVPR